MNSTAHLTPAPVEASVPAVVGGSRTRVDPAQPPARSSACLLSALALFATLAFATPGGSANAQPQERTASVAATLKTLRETPGVFESRAATLRSRVDRKRTHLAKLNMRLDQARTEPNDRLRAHQLSRYAYQAFLVGSHLAAEAAKLREIEALMAIRPRVQTSQAPALVEQELAAAHAGRIDTAQRLMQEAQQYRPTITEPAFLAQFDHLVATIQSDLKRLESLR